MTYPYIGWFMCIKLISKISDHIRLTEKAKFLKKYLMFFDLAIKQTTGWAPSASTLPLDCKEQKHGNINKM